MTVYYTDSTITLHHGDCLDVLRSLPDASVDAVCTDPPYGLEFMGKGWDAPWRESDVNADAGMSEVGYTDGGKRLPRPSFTGSTNPKCLVCKGTRRGRRDGTAKVAVCLCDDGGRFPNVRAVEMRAFAEWCETWAVECYRVLKPGGHFLAFGGTRTFHRLACAVEDAGFEIRDSLAWLYGSGFPKSLDVSKAIDKAAGAERAKVQKPGAASAYSANAGNDRPWMQLAREQGFIEVDGNEPATPDAERWQGWGTALKPAFEPVVMARKPLAGTVAGNVLAHGTGALNVDGCRVDSGGVTGSSKSAGSGSGRPSQAGVPFVGGIVSEAHPAGRWPANVILDESQAAELDAQSGESVTGSGPLRRNTALGVMNDDGWEPQSQEGIRHPGEGGASRFFYVADTKTDPYLASAHEERRPVEGPVLTDPEYQGPRFRYVAKADASERVRVNGVAHPTVKPLSIMRWLVRLVTPPGGTVLEPFAGSGTTVEACILEGFRCVAIEREADYLPLIVQRINRRRDPVEAVKAAGDDGGLFDLFGEVGA